MTYYRSEESGDMTPSEDDRKGPPRRNDDKQPSMMKILGIVLGCVTLGSLIFTAGYNWRGVDTLEKNQDQFVRKEVLSEQLRNLNQSIEELRRQIEDMRGEQREARRKPQ